MMPNTIELMIKRCKFTEDEIRTAIRGECMWFAIALNDIMSDRLIKGGLVVAAPLNAPESQWNHALVEHRHEYYDIRGKVIATDVHAEFKTGVIRESSRTELMNRFPMVASDIKIKSWNDRLITSAEPLSLLDS